MEQKLIWLLIYTLIGLTIAFMLDDIKWYWWIIIILFWPILCVVLVIELMYISIFYIHKLVKKGIVKLWSFRI